MIIIKIFLLISLIKLQDTAKPLSLALIYASLSFLVGIIFSPFLEVIISSIITIFLVWLYFWLLDKLEGSILWWLVMIIGLLIVLV
ncbi:hypothetical protein HOD96_02175 [Candidatus Falkowbacteria bacterium]|nr:hypothetical protein [Candidatus Falkowbacteria bacterium]MBT4433098.1 hypothetical protein [Candidatus Falkowbacteria bacterium]